MLVIPGMTGKDTCDGITRRDLLRIGGSAGFGFSLANLFNWQETSAQQKTSGGPGFGKAKSVILVYLQRGPTHPALWGPNENSPHKLRHGFHSIDPQLPVLNI